MSVVTELIAEGERILSDGSKDDAKRFIEEACDVLEDCGVSNPRRGLEASTIGFWIGDKPEEIGSDIEEYMKDVRMLIRRLRTIEERSPSVHVRNDVTVNVDITVMMDVQSQIQKSDELSQQTKDELVDVLKQMSDEMSRNNRNGVVDRLRKYLEIGANSATIAQSLGALLGLLSSWFGMQIPG